MSKPLLNRGKMLAKLSKKTCGIEKIIKNNCILFAALMLTIFGSLVRVWDSQPVYYAHAYAGVGKSEISQSPLFAENSPIFAADGKQKSIFAEKVLKIENKIIGQSTSSQDLEKKIFEIVEDSPISEMVPFIAKRDQRTAAFLIGIAKKESSFGSASPSKDGKTCYNYWGYKSSGSRGVGMGYACFGSPEEAVQVVGDRIAQLVAKERNTPQRMVDTWKCGRSCAGDKGAPSWVSTVAMYFEKIVDLNV